jgi:hypothetical protein
MGFGKPTELAMRTAEGTVGVGGGCLVGQGRPWALRARKADWRFSFAHSDTSVAVAKREKLFLFETE